MGIFLAQYQPHVGNNYTFINKKKNQVDYQTTQYINHFFFHVSGLLPKKLGGKQEKADSKNIQRGPLFSDYTDWPNDCQM